VAAPPVVILNAGRGAEMLPRGTMPLGETYTREVGREFVIVGEESYPQT
jgi:hypothetical protein